LAATNRLSTFSRSSTPARNHDSQGERVGGRLRQVIAEQEVRMSTTSSVSRRSRSRVRPGTAATASTWTRSRRQRLRDRRGSARPFGPALRARSFVRERKIARHGAVSCLSRSWPSQRTPRKRTSSRSSIRSSARGQSLKPDHNRSAENDLATSEEVRSPGKPAPNAARQTRSPRFILPSWMASSCRAGSLRPWCSGSAGVVVDLLVR